MPDLLDLIRGQLRARLDELRPLVREHQRLQDAERALGEGPPARAKRPAPPKPAEPRRGSGARRGSRRRSSAPAEREANRQKILAFVGERPGITRAELKDAASLSGAGVGQNLRRMLDRGEVREEALPGGATGYRIADDRTAPSASGREGKPGR